MKHFFLIFFIALTKIVFGQDCSQIISIPATPPSRQSELFRNVIYPVYGISGTRIYSSYDITGNGTYITIPSSNGFWICKNGNDGPLNRCGGWSQNARPFQKEGFSVCVDLQSSKEYFVGFAADNFARLIIDDSIIIDQRYTDDQENLLAWKLFKVKINKGTHFIQVLGNNGNGGPATIGLEIYNNTQAEIISARSYNDLNLIFSSKDRFNLPVQVGDPTLSYSCPVGYSIDFCNSTIPVCSKVINYSINLKVNNPQPVCSKKTVNITESAITAGSDADLTLSYWIDSLATQSLANPSEISSSGTYYIKAVNKNNCSSIKPVEVQMNFYPQPVVDFTVNNSTQCFTGNSFVFTNNSSISSGTNTYSWIFGDSETATTSDATHHYTAEGIYTVKLVATSNNGCIDSVSKLVTVNVSPSGTINSPISNIICSGSAILLKATGGDNYQWQLNGSNISGANSSTYAASVPGVYTAILISSANCTAPAVGSVSLTLINKPTAAFTFQNYCVNVPVIFTNSSNTSQSGAVTYNWSFGNGVISSQSSPSDQIYKTEGSYTTKLVVTPTACPSLADSLSKVINIVTPPSNIRYPAMNVIKNIPYLLQARNIGDSYNWVPSAGLSNARISNPTYNYSTGTDYRINISNAAGCTIVDSLLIRAFGKRAVYVPKAFAPNGNGSNDLLRPILVGIPTITYFRIYNRWGQLIYETKNIGQGWDGRFKGTTQPIETYTWVFEGVDYEGQIVRESGKSTLLR
jgi:gliding motility-associated-like protein